jgi:NitT/TauT family transport system ATP-binding protein
MAGLDEPTEGTIHYHNCQVGDAAFVFQHFALLPWLTVEKNIALGLHHKKLSAQAKYELVARELERFGLVKFAAAYPRELSGGMQQRVGLARALATDPTIILLDEPFSELDSFTAEELRQELLNIWQKTKITIVMVTHLISEAIEMADRIVALSPSPGRVEATTQNKLARPRNLRSKAAFALEDKLRQILKP